MRFKKEEFCLKKINKTKLLFKDEQFTGSTKECLEYFMREIELSTYVNNSVLREGFSILMKYGPYTFTAEWGKPPITIKYEDLEVQIEKFKVRFANHVEATLKKGYTLKIKSDGSFDEGQFELKEDLDKLNFKIDVYLSI